MGGPVWVDETVSMFAVQPPETLNEGIACRSDSPTGHCRYRRPTRHGEQQRLRLRSEVFPLICIHRQELDPTEHDRINDCIFTFIPPATTWSPRC